MSDFNADNAKIDAALAAVAAGVPYVKLLDVTTTEDSQQIDIDVSTIDLTQYRRLDIHLDPGDSRTDGANQCFLRINGLDSGYYIGNSASAELSRANVGTSAQAFSYVCFHLYLGPVLMASVDDYMTNIGTPCNAMHTYSDLVGYLDSTPDQIQTLNLVPNTTLPIKAGMRIAIYGLRK
jgi:hypothetical protein